MQKLAVASCLCLVGAQDVFLKISDAEGPGSSWKRPSKDARVWVNDNYATEHEIADVVSLAASGNASTWIESGFAGVYTKALNATAQVRKLWYDKLAQATGVTYCAPCEAEVGPIRVRRYPSGHGTVPHMDGAGNHGIDTPDFTLIVFLRDAGGATRFNMQCSKLSPNQAGR